jgi:hypothetical protein
MAGDDLLGNISIASPRVLQINRFFPKNSVFLPRRLIFIEISRRINTFESRQFTSASFFDRRSIFNATASELGRVIRQRRLSEELRIIGSHENHTDLRLAGRFMLQKLEGTDLFLLISGCNKIMSAPSIVRFSIDWPNVMFTSNPPVTRSASTPRRGRND